MEGKKSILTKVLATLLVVAIITIGIMGGFIFKINKDKNEEISQLKEQVKKASETSSELQGKLNSIADIINSSKETTTMVSKIDENKDWVYDAEYKKDAKAESYVAEDKTYYARDIVVPYININSSYASDSNTEIKKVFDDAMKKYNEGVNDKMTYVEQCNYRKYMKDNHLSVTLTYGVGATDVVVPDYYTYNINLENGTQLSYEDAYKICGFNDANIESKVEEAITKVMKDELNGVTFEDGKNFDTYNKQSIDNYKKSVANNTVKYYISDNERLNVVVVLSIPAGIGEFPHLITIE